MTRRQFLILIVPLLITLIGIAAVRLAGPVGPRDHVYWDGDLAYRVRASLDREFVWGVPRDGEKAREAFYKAMNTYLDTFDAYGELVPPWRLEERRDRTQGRYAGVGLLTPVLGVDEPIKSLKVDGVCPDGPADRAGIKVGDEIISVNGIAISVLCADAGPGGATDQIKGPVHTSLTLGVRTQGIEREVSIVRDHISRGSVFGTRIGDGAVGYIRVGGFHPDTAKDFAGRLQTLLDQDIRGLVIDLRGNRGGMLEAAVELVDALLDEGIILKVQYRDGSEVHRATREGTLAPDLPLVLLVNRHSASAAEIVAGALRDHGRATLVGERTFGKFAVQTLREVPTREELPALLKITTALYLTPDGHYYQRRYRDPHRNDPRDGLPPDLAIAVPAEDEIILQQIFASQEYADWKVDPKPVHPEFADRVLEAGFSLLRGEPVSPELLVQASGAGK